MRDERVLQGGGGGIHLLQAMVWMGFATEVIIQMNFLCWSWGLEGRMRSRHLLPVSFYALTSRTDMTLEHSTLTVSQLRQRQLEGERCFSASTECSFVFVFFSASNMIILSIFTFLSHKMRPSKYTNNTVNSCWLFFCKQCLHCVFSQVVPVLWPTLLVDFIMIPRSCYPRYI